MKPDTIADETLYQDTLSQDARAYREAFCRQYVVDFCAYKALIRTGFIGKSPKARASQIMREPYVANRIVELVNERAETDIVKRNQVMAKFWEEANDPDNASVARVSALAHIAKMLGMFLGKGEDADKESENPTGVMGIPLVRVEDWANSAASMQANLKSGIVARRLPTAPPAQPAQTWN